MCGPARVLTDVAEDVGELERDPASFGQQGRFRRFEAEDVDDGDASYRRHLIAVAVQFIERADAARFHVGSDTLYHLVKAVLRDAVAGDGVGQGGPDRIVVQRAGQSAVKPSAPGFQALARRARFVAQVVRTPHEGVDGAHGIALRLRQHHERVVKIPRAFPGHPAAEFIGFFKRQAHAAFENTRLASVDSSRRTLSPLPMVGRRSSTS